MSNGGQSEQAHTQPPCAPANTLEAVSFVDVRHGRRTETDGTGPPASSPACTVGKKQRPSRSERSKILLVADHGTVNVLYEDEHILALDKPANVPMQPEHRAA